MCASVCARAPELDVLGFVTTDANKNTCRCENVRAVAAAMGHHREHMIFETFFESSLG